ncbi:cysteine desulfurase family protein [Siminovitchia sp. FSL H7-0308]|uniref:cysteine desulfurase n=1 Tax=Siminovitchia thermophila TaxID=1245522 RepID=A0ABS2RA32_9BACI|nr:cysteine desulfurase family protein [Siminovitchia thermophila]MBM7716507.1 cysteine desulfurase [Siminovitchia thermophila]ONK24149.1 cysteine desulfurase NifS [Bacillus sp. VT-16-64]
MNKMIYLDHAATTPVHPEAAEKMFTLMKDVYGNPSSIHTPGREARRILDEARMVIAQTISANVKEIIFTSGGTESDNLAVLGAALANREKGQHIITTSFEHHAVLDACKFLEREGFDVTYLDPDINGMIHPEDVKKALRDDTILVTIMFANNEVGTIQPIKEIGAILSGHQAYFHTDAVQAYGTEKLNVNELQVDFLSASSHKINGPKGVGFLYVKSGSRLIPRQYGGEQEQKKRPGTENLVSIAGFAEAAKIAGHSLNERIAHYRHLKDSFVETFKVKGIDFFINGSLEQSVPHVLNVSFPGTDVEPLLVNLDLAGIAASSGSACTAGTLDPSHVLTAMFGKESDRVNNSVRFSFGLGNTVEQVKEAAEKTAEIVRKLLSD